MRCPIAEKLRLTSFILSSGMVALGFAPSAFADSLTDNLGCITINGMRECRHVASSPNSGETNPYQQRNKMLLQRKEQALIEPLLTPAPDVSVAGKPASSDAPATLKVDIPNIQPDRQVKPVHGFIAAATEEASSPALPKAVTGNPSVKAVALRDAPGVATPPLSSFTPTPEHKRMALLVMPALRFLMPIDSTARSYETADISHPRRQAMPPADNQSTLPWWKRLWGLRDSGAASAPAAPKGNAQEAVAMAELKPAAGQEKSTPATLASLAPAAGAADTDKPLIELPLDTPQNTAPPNPATPPAMPAPTIPPAVAPASAAPAVAMPPAAPSPAPLQQPAAMPPAASPAPSSETAPPSTHAASVALPPGNLPPSVAPAAPAAKNTVPLSAITNLPAPPTPGTPAYLPPALGGNAATANAPLPAGAANPLSASGIPVFSPKVGASPITGPLAAEGGSASGSELSSANHPTPSASSHKQPASSNLVIDRATDMQDVFKAGDTPTESVRHEAMGIKIEVKKPKLDMNHELEKAYDALIAGQTPAAIEFYRSVLSNDPGNTQALFGLATAYHRAGQMEVARALYSKLLAADPGNRDALNNFLVLLGDAAPQEALSQLEALQRKNPRFSPIPAQIAVIHEKLGDDKLATSSMMRAIELSPENLTYRYNLAIMLDKQNRWDEAAKLYQQLIQAWQRGEVIPGNAEKIQQRLTFISSNKP